MDKESLKYIIKQFNQKLPRSILPRDIEIPLDSNKIITLIGIRRTGKTYILFDAINRLLAQGIDYKCIIYLNFEDDRLLPILPTQIKA